MSSRRDAVAWWWHSARFRRALVPLALGAGLVPGAAPAELYFAKLMHYDPIVAFDLGYGAKLPAVRMAYVRTTVGDRFTEISVHLEDPDFRLLGHSCPTSLANGKGCMVFFSLDPSVTGDPEAGGRIYQGALEVRSREGATALHLSAHTDARYCDARGLPLNYRCPTPAR
jgi:hypothetical protein